MAQVCAAKYSHEVRRQKSEVNYLPRINTNFSLITQTDRFVFLTRIYTDLHSFLEFWISATRLRAGYRLLTSAVAQGLPLRIKLRSTGRRTSASMREF